MATSTNAHNRRNRTGARSSSTKKRQSYTERDSADALSRCYDSITGTVYHTEGYDATGLRAAKAITLSNDDYSKEVVIPLMRIAYSCSEVKRTCQRHHDASRPMSRARIFEDTNRLGAWTPEGERSPSHDTPPNQAARTTAQPCPECVSIVWEVLFGFQDGDRYVKGVIPVLNRLGDKSSSTRQSLAQLRTTINNVAIDQHRARQVSAGRPAKPAASVACLHLADPATERIVTVYFITRLSTGCSHREGVESAALDLLGRQPEMTIQDARSTARAAIIRAQGEVGEERWRSTITDAIITRSAAGPVSLDQSFDADEDGTRSGYALLDSLDTPLPSTEPVKDPTAGARRRNNSRAADEEQRSAFREALRSALANPANDGHSDLEVAISVMTALADDSSTAYLMCGPFQEQYSGEHAGERVRELLRDNPEALATLRALIKDCRREAGRKQKSRRPSNKRSA
jgi:hypothetical protein